VEDWSNGLFSCEDAELEKPLPTSELGLPEVWFSAEIIGTGRSRTGAERAKENGGGEGTSSNGGGGEAGGISA